MLFVQKRCEGFLSEPRVVQVSRFQLGCCVQLQHAAEKMSACLCRIAATLSAERGACVAVCCHNGVIKQACSTSAVLRKQQVEGLFGNISDAELMVSALRVVSVPES